MLAAVMERRYSDRGLVGLGVARSLSETCDATLERSSGDLSPSWRPKEEVLTIDAIVVRGSDVYPFARLAAIKKDSEVDDNSVGKKALI